MNKNHCIYIIVGLMILLAGCAVDTKMYPPVPALEFSSSESSLSRNAEGVDTLFYVVLYFSLIDGDGDIGDIPNADVDTVILPSTNCFIDMYYYEDGHYVMDTLLKANEYTIPYVSNDGQDKLLKADLKIEIPYSLSSQLLFPYDSIYYSITVTDREKHLSNAIISDTIAYTR